MSDQNQNGNGSGRPRKGESPLTLDVLEQIARMELDGWPETEIAKKVGISRRSVRTVLQEEIRPLWRVLRPGIFDKVLARLERQYRENWEAWEKSKKPQITVRYHKGLVNDGTDIGIVGSEVTKEQSTGDVRYQKMCFDILRTEAELLGLFDKMAIQEAHEDDMRVAGPEGQAAANDLAKRLAKRLKEIAHHKALEQQK